jgi:phage major head subunit gpT-like protein
MGQPYTLVSRDAQVALTEFSNEFTAALALADVDPWAERFGLSVRSRALRTVFPISISAPGYHELKGELKYRKLAEKSLELKPKTWQDGVTELADVIEAPDFIGWAEQPDAMAREAQRLPNDIIADLLEANPTTTWDNLSFFNSAHPINPLDTSLGTYDNDFTGAGTAPTAANLSLAMQAFDGLVGLNGKSLGMRMTHVLHPPAQTQLWKELLERDLIIATSGTSFGAVNNIYKGSVIPVPVYELSNSAKWYPLASRPGVYPWIVQTETAPEEIRRDKSSEYYATTLKVSIAYILRANGVLAMPFTMQRWEGLA